MYSLVIPVYLNEGSIPDLLAACEGLDRELGGRLEVVFVVDGSPDGSAALLADLLPKSEVRSQLLLLSRNFGSFAAIRAGLAAARGHLFAVTAADLQEPPELALEFFRTLESEPVDVTIGKRSHRADPMLSRLGSRVFWGLYRRFVVKDMPPGGVDVFGCNLDFRNQLLALEESNSSLVALLLWLGFRRKFIEYERRPREHGKSAWTLAKKLRYMMDSVYGFTDLPIKVLSWIGVTGLVFSAALALVILVARLTGAIAVPGYAATLVTILFLGGLNSFGLGVIGSYVWRTFENSKERPQTIVMARRTFDRENEEAS